MPALWKTLLPLALFTASSLARTSVDTDAHMDMALQALERKAQELVDDQRIVGGELLVVQRGQTLLNTSFGWIDHELGQEMSTGALYCVRSMTKPLVGTVTQMLIDEGALDLSLRVAEVLPEFDKDELRKITVEHLLTHTSGLPLTTLSGALSNYTVLRDLAQEASSVDLLFSPGSGFQYSDAGTDVLGAVLEEVTRRSLSQLVSDRILIPLEMKDTRTVLGESTDWRDRVPVAYSGGTGAWSRHWAPENGPIFPLFLGSQSLYSTTADYAVFLQSWLDRYQGRAVPEFPLSQEAVERALTPVSAIPAYPDQDAAAYYGQLWLVRATEPGKVVRFGHDGSDGTYGWVWPDHELIVLFFTQSRGSMAGLEIEQFVQQHLVEAKPLPTANTAAISSSIEGLYWDEDVEHAVYDVSRKGNLLELDRPGGMHMVFRATDEEDRFNAEDNAKIWIRFLRDDSGVVTAMETFFGKRTEIDPRHVHDPALPTADTVIRALTNAHQVGRLKDEALELRGQINFVDRGMSGTFNTIIDATRARNTVHVGGMKETTWSDGDSAWSQSSFTGKTQLDGAQREQVVRDHPRVQFGDWREFYSEVRVLKRIEMDSLSLLLVHAKSPDSRSVVFFIDEATGRLYRRDALVQIPGVGIVGVQTLFQDFQSIDGMVLPHKTESLFVTNLMGRIRTEVESAESVDAELATFTPDGS